MKNAILFTLFIFFNLNIKADYRYRNICQVVSSADYGAIGTIVKIDNNYFYLKVDNYILNKLEKDTLPIVKFEDWASGKRYDKYKVGQKELVFFKKSNYVLKDYELIGIGAGGENELPIFNDSIRFQKGSNRKYESYNLDNFIRVILDYNILINKYSGVKKIIAQTELEIFLKKSEFHKQLVECRLSNQIEDFEFPKNGNMVNLERNYLYQDYENKILIYNPTKDSIYIAVENSEVWKQGEYYIVKPHDGWTRRFIDVYSSKEKNKQDILYNQIFEVLELPEPSLYFNNSIKDTIHYSYYTDVIPTVGYYLDDLHHDEYLNYSLLNYEYEITSNGKSEIFKIKSQKGTKDFHDRLKSLKAGDKISLSNIYVLYPDNKVRQLRNKSIIIRTE